MFLLFFCFIGTTVQHLGSPFGGAGAAKPRLRGQISKDALYRFGDAARQVIYPLSQLR